MENNKERMSLIARYHHAVAVSDDAEAVMYQYAPSVLLCRKLAERDALLQKMDWVIGNVYGEENGIADLARQLQEYAETVPPGTPLEQMYQRVWHGILEPMQKKLDWLEREVTFCRYKLWDDVPMPKREELLLQMGFHDITEPIKKARELLVGEEAGKCGALEEAAGWVEMLETLSKINRERADFAVECARTALQPAYRMKNLRLLRTLNELLYHMWYLDTNRWGDDRDEDYRQRLIGYTKMVMTELPGI